MIARWKASCCAPTFRRHDLLRERPTELFGALRFEVHVASAQRRAELSEHRAQRRRCARAPAVLSRPGLPDVERGPARRTLARLLEDGDVAYSDFAASREGDFRRNVATLP
jgi:hypothetical protein